MRRRRIILKPEAKDFERDLNLSFNDLRQQVDELSDSFLLDAVLITGVQLPDGEARLIPHGLQRPLSGWWVADLLDPTATGRIERVLTVTSKTVDASTYLALKQTGYGGVSVPWGSGTANVITVSLVVF